jgi:hypothetical protein
MAKLHPALAAGAMLVCMAPLTAGAQQHVALPPVNLGNTSFLDGEGGPGLMTHEQVTLYDASRIDGPSGQALPGRDMLTTFTAITHLAYSPSTKVLGSYWGVEILVPVAFVDVATPTALGSTAGIGDITLSPLVFQAPTVTLLGGKFFHRLDLDVVAPTGRYDRDALVNVGSHVWSLNPYYAFTWLLGDRFETSWRIHYLWNSVNDAPGPAYAASSIQPGQAIHFNAAFSVQVTKMVRAGVAGYFLQQITDSRADGRAVAGSRERVGALGPGLFVGKDATTQLVANAYCELAVENRPAGARFNVYFLHVW